MPFTKPNADQPSSPSQVETKAVVAMVEPYVPAIPKEQLNAFGLARQMVVELPEPLQRWAQAEAPSSVRGIPPEPKLADFADREEFEEARAGWRHKVGKIVSLMSRSKASPACGRARDLEDGFRDFLR
jgi:hypothetical protein